MMDREFFEQQIFFLATQKDLGIQFIDSCPFGEFLERFIENNYFIREVIGERDNKGRFKKKTWEVVERRGPRTYSQPSDTREEAELHVLSCLYWNFCNRDVDAPVNDFSRDALVRYLREKGIHVAPKQRIEQLLESYQRRLERYRKEKEQQLLELVGDDRQVIVAWYESEMFHPAPDAVMNAKRRLGLTWKQVREIGRSAQTKNNTP